MIWAKLRKRNDLQNMVNMVDMVIHIHTAMAMKNVTRIMEMDMVMTVVKIMVRKDMLGMRDMLDMLDMVMSLHDITRRLVASALSARAWKWNP